MNPSVRALTSCIGAPPTLTPTCPTAFPQNRVLKVEGVTVNTMSRGGTGAWKSESSQRNFPNRKWLHVGGIDTSIHAALTPQSPPFTNRPYDLLISEDCSHARLLGPPIMEARVARWRMAALPKPTRPRLANAGPKCFLPRLVFTASFDHLRVHPFPKNVLRIWDDLLVGTENGEGGQAVLSICLRRDQQRRQREIPTR